MTENLDSCNYPVPNAFGGGKQETGWEKRGGSVAKKGKKERKGKKRKNKMKDWEKREQFSWGETKGGNKRETICRSNRIEEGTPVFRGTMEQ
jgi:hypothetical protein